ncbi:hypothetical protein JCM1393_03290 [Clostridium carnis]
MNYNDDDSILDPEIKTDSFYNSDTRQPPFNNFPIPGFPNINFPGENFPGSQIQGSSNVGLGAPPLFVPSKSGSEVVHMNSLTYDGPKTKAVSQNSIRFCLFKFIYIWETSGRRYWAYLINVDKVSISGFRWFRGRWVYFGLDLKKIDSFICYRSTSQDSCTDNYTKPIEKEIKLSRKEHSLNSTKDIYTKTLASLDIPEIKDDFVTESIGIVDDSHLTSKIPCMKSRIASYRITLELSYPSNIDNDIKEKINKIASDAAEKAIETLSKERASSSEANPLENFNNSIKLINSALSTFSNNFTSKLKGIIHSKNLSKKINYSIREEKFTTGWTII